MNSDRVYLIYQNVPHYRVAVFRCLCETRDGAPEYTLFAGNTTNLNGLKIVDVSRDSSADSEHTSRWKILRNYWCGELLFQPGVIALAFDKKCDCIIYFGSVYYISTWISALFARMIGKRVLFWTHGYRHRESKYKALLRNTFYRIAHGILVYGHRAKEILKEYGFSGDRIYVVYNSLDYDGQILYRDASRIGKSDVTEIFDGDNPVLLWVGRMMPSRKLDLLFDGIKRMKDDGQCVSVMLVGDGENRKDLELLCHELGVHAQIHFYGACHDEKKLAQIFHSADLVICPGDIGLLAMHALMYGVPVVTHDNMDLHKPEVEAIMPGVSGDFFAYDDSQSLANCVLDWFESHPDKSVNREQCYAVIDEKYNPKHQKRSIDQAVLGLPPLD